MREKALTTSNLVAQLAATLGVPFIAAAFLAAYMIYGASFFEGRDNIYTIIAYLAALASMMPHELLHAVGYMVAGGKKWADFNFKMKFPVSASIQFNGDMQVNGFLVGALLPFVVTSLVPIAAGLLFGNFYLLSYGCLEALACGSDLQISLMTWKYRGMICYDPGITGIVVKLGE